MTVYRRRDVLPYGYELLWYEARSVLGQGSFGITYLAHDMHLDRPVAIKEYLPGEFAVREENSTVQPATGEDGETYRWGLERFIDEARTLARFKHKNIVQVLTFFEQNSTAYMVMEYEQGEDLETLFKQGKLREETDLLKIFLAILDGLALVHDAGFIHRDIKPANIYIRRDGSPVLLDFGSARQAVGRRTRTLTSVITSGYAPFEQYDASGKQGPWTDIYAVGASLYEAITGKPPANALQRSQAIINHEPDPYVPATGLEIGRYSDDFRGAVDYALRFRPTDRPQDLRTWRLVLEGKQRIAPLLGETTIRSAERATVLMPSRKVAQLLDRAEDDVNAGHFISPPGHNALERYREVLALEPNNPRAKQGLSQLQEQYLELAEKALNRRGLESAKQHLDTADKILPGTEAVQLGRTGLAELTRRRIHARKRRLLVFTLVGLTALLGSAALVERIRRRRDSEARVGELLAQAESDVGAGRLEGALNNYQRVLELDPDNPAARDGLYGVYLRLASDAIAVREFVKASQHLDNAETIRPGTEEVKRLRRKLVPTSSVARAQFTNGIRDREPIDSIDSMVCAEREEFKQLFYFTEVLNMRGETVSHRWEYAGQVVAELKFPIGGNRWRVWSRRNLTMVGQWRVVVTDSAGRLLHTDSFVYQCKPSAQ